MNEHIPADERCPHGISLTAFPGCHFCEYDLLRGLLVECRPYVVKADIGEQEHPHVLLNKIDALLKRNAHETVNGGSFPKLEFAEHCGCCTRNKITLDVFASPSKASAFEVCLKAAPRQCIRPAGHDGECDAVKASDPPGSYRDATGELVLPLAKASAPLCPSGHPAEALDLDIARCSTCGWQGHIRALKAESAFQVCLKAAPGQCIRPAGHDGDCDAMNGGVGT